MHRRLSGELPEPAGRFAAGTRWAADDPGLLLWILATLVDSSLIVFDRYVGTLDRRQRESYWEDYRIVGSLFGLADRDMPAGLRDLEAYTGDMLAGDVHHVSPRADAPLRRGVHEASRSAGAAAHDSIRPRVGRGVAPLEP